MKKRIKKKDLVSISIFFILVSFIIPFVIRTENETNLTVVSASLTAVGTITTLITLFIAFQLYERFGLESRFIGNQTDKVLELVDFFKGKSFKASTNKYSYFCGTNRDKISLIKNGSNYPIDKSKIVLMNYDDYTKTWDQLFEIKRSYWLPEKLKKKIEFMEFIMLDDVPDAFDEKYIRISASTKRDENVEWLKVIPEITFDEFNSKLDILIKAIEKWLKQHSDIRIDLNLAEPEKYKNSDEK